MCVSCAALSVCVSCAALSVCVCVCVYYCDEGLVEHGGG